VDSVRCTQRGGACRAVEVSAPTLDCKASAGQLHTVQEATAVSHGDENLDLTDFLTRVGSEVS